MRLSRLEVDVSIRSPHRSKGRQGAGGGGGGVLEFQSAPLTEARGDCGKSEIYHTGACFNPLPSPKQGETGILWSFPVGFRVSIRSPHRSKGRRYPCAFRAWRSMFQSAPLTEARGDTSLRSDLAQSIRFQSAPLTEARGDRQLRRHIPNSNSFNPLPSPKQGETMQGR